MDYASPIHNHMLLVVVDVFLQNGLMFFQKNSASLATTINKLKIFICNPWHSEINCIQ